jgi:hypothetical protein
MIYQLNHDSKENYWKSLLHDSLFQESTEVVKFSEALYLLKFKVWSIVPWSYSSVQVPSEFGQFIFVDFSELLGC